MTVTFLKTSVMTMTMVLVALVGMMIFQMIKPTPRVENFVIARAGEWVTDLDGNRVCKLNATLTRYSVVTSSFCSEWQGPRPSYGQTVPWMRGRAGGMQIMIEGQWRP